MTSYESNIWRTSLISSSLKRLKKTERTVPSPVVFIVLSILCWTKSRTRSTNLLFDWYRHTKFRAFHPSLVSLLMSVFFSINNQTISIWNFLCRNIENRANRGMWSWSSIFYFQLIRRKQEFLFQSAQWRNCNQT